MTAAIAVLISGRGSNLQALIDAIAGGALRAEIRLVIANRADAPGLARARSAGLDTRIVPHGQYADRVAYDRALADAIGPLDIRFVCLAGFMRLLGPAFCDAFPRRVLNIHPSLLPAFPGVHAPRQALAHGVKVSGATVHLVTPELDAGPIVAQAAVPVLDDDTEERLAERILGVEHAIYPAAIERLVYEPWRVEGRRVVFGSSGGPGAGDGRLDRRP